MKALPNILTGARLALSLLVLIALVASSGTAPFAGLHEATRHQLQSWAFVGFVVAAVSDFFDGWLARKLNATSLLGAILDPIADKVLIAAAITGLVAAGQTGVALPGGLILFREFSVSALRETLAPRGLRLPVTLLAKCKTTVQLIALALLMFLPVWGDWGLPCIPALQSQAAAVALGLLWLAAAITVWTGIEYALAARKALKG